MTPSTTPQTPQTPGSTPTMPYSVRDIQYSPTHSLPTKFRGGERVQDAVLTPDELAVYTYVRHIEAERDRLAAELADLRAKLPSIDKLVADLVDLYHAKATAPKAVGSPKPGATAKDAKDDL